jgi:hypothetical protein
MLLLFVACRDWGMTIPWNPSGLPDLREISKVTGNFTIERGASRSLLLCIMRLLKNEDEIRNALTLPGAT